MALDVGTRLGAYEITGTLGAGGMGEVYRATDTNLKREVAIKILPSTLAEDADRLARFQREAEVLALLNHPNIAQIYGLERSGGTTALVMELVEGPTLADRIAQGSIPPDEALHLAMQIADALEAAHGRSIVHRDLKPANIKLTAEGTVKVLDFGIAKALETQAGVGISGPQTPSLTTPAMTQAGILLGTAGYMSPEQARGKAVDERADIWAFGCVLYEMLTGQPAFAGEDVPTTLARVLANDTDLDSIPASISSDVRRTIKLCLAKDARKRLADIRDVRLALAGAFEVEPHGTADRETVSRPFWRRSFPVAAAAVIAGLVVGLIVWSLRPEMPPQFVNRFTYEFPAVQTLSFPQYPVMAFSADGRRFVYRTGGGLYVRSLDQLGAQLIAGTEKRTFTTPVLSPDGQFVAYFSNGNAAVERIAISGGEPQVIAGAGPPFGASWASDGTILYGQAGGIFRVSANGGMPTLVIKPKKGERLYGPELLPDGDTVLFSATTTGNWDDAEIVAQSLSSGKRTVLVKGGSDARYVAGRLIFARGDRLFGIAFDPKTLTVSGNAVPLVQGVMRSAAGTTGTANYGVSKDGTLVYVSGSAQTATARQLVWVDTEGHETPVPLPPRAYDQVVLSPDGAHAALGIEGGKQVWIADLKRGTLERLPADLGNSEPTILFFSADGQRVASSAVRDGRYAVVWQAADGTGAAETLATFDASVIAVLGGALSPDGKRFVPDVLLRKSADLGIVAVGDPTSYRDFLATPAAELGAAISPDGHWITYTSNDTGTFQVYVQRFPEGGGRLAVSIKGGIFPHWSADGNALTYMGLDGLAAVSLMRVPVTGLEGSKSSPTFGTPKEVFPWKYFFDTSGKDHFDMTADGQRFLMITVASQSNEAARFVVVTHWVQELKRLMPTE